MRVFHKDGVGRPSVTDRSRASLSRHAASVPLRRAIGNATSQNTLPHQTIQESQSLGIAIWLAGSFTRMINHSRLWLNEQEIHALSKASATAHFNEVSAHEPCKRHKVCGFTNDLRGRARFGIFAIVNLPAPSILGLKKSFGYGDRLGLATPGHLAASRKFKFAPIFAQQSIREMARTQRTPVEVMRAAQNALAGENFADPWGADADHLKTADDVKVTAAAGFCFFTIDPSEFVNNRADTMNARELEEAVAQLEKDKIFADDPWRDGYLGKRFEVANDLTLEFTTENLFRAAVKYARAIAHSEIMGRHIAAANTGRAFEIEVSVDETDSPTSPLEHLFFGLELQRRRVPNVVSLAPRFVGEFEKGIDFRGDLKQFEASLRQHVAIARHCGPYKISVHSGSDKFTAYPIIGRVCGELLHVKTAGTSYLEALRVVARQAPGAFAEIAAYSCGRFDTDRKSYHISTTTDEIAGLPAFSGKEEALYLDERIGRQLLHVTFGSVLTLGQDAKGRRFKDTILELLERHADLHREFLDRHFTKHLALLGQG